MIQVECPFCNMWQKVENKICAKCARQVRGGVYVTRVTWTKPDGSKRKDAVRHPGLTLAETKLEHEKRLDQARGPSRVFHQMRLSQVLAIYTDHLKIRSPEGATQAARYFRYIVDFLGDPLASEVDHGMACQFQTHLGNDRKLSAGSINAAIQWLKCAWRFAAPDHKNPFTRLQPFRTEPVVEFLTEDEERRLLAAAKEYSQTFYEIISFSLMTGYRKTEVLTLRRSEVDFDAGVMVKTVKGGKKQFKPMTRGVHALLLSVADNGTDFFWVNPDTRKPYKHPYFGFKAIKKAAGITKPFRWHGLRHSTGYKLLTATGNLEAVRRLLGHSQITTTTRYVHMQMEDLREAATCLDLADTPILNIVK